MGAAQIVVICLFVTVIVLNGAKNGQQKKNPNYHVGEAILNVLIWILLLWWGGFWNN